MIFFTLMRMEIHRDISNVEQITALRHYFTGPPNLSACSTTSRGRDVANLETLALVKVPRRHREDERVLAGSKGSCAPGVGSDRVPTSSSRSNIHETSSLVHPHVSGLLGRAYFVFVYSTSAADKSNQRVPPLDLIRSRSLPWGLLDLPRGRARSTLRL